MPRNLGNRHLNDQFKALDSDATACRLLREELNDANMYAEKQARMADGNCNPFGNPASPGPGNVSIKVEGLQRRSGLMNPG